MGDPETYVIRARKLLPGAESIRVEELRGPGTAFKLIVTANHSTAWCPFDVDSLRLAAVICARKLGIGVTP